ncbi:hypothetical protein BGZ80_001184 [Entomortierella chlamydospora]|uniref:Peptidase s41 family protein n=1 Tax=Entomortierella chlamydospora TaxID=101097 RepID=A0A9P6MS14_9FUNG|nr:hypothetical protein BGZ79_008799 [Entomortierella chlamydospora]KAG0010788.1 hypothetical protein BGZ80_001184 [Entomortierella chlamydospora]
MVSPSLRSLVASAYLIASIALSTAAPIHNEDACGILGATDAAVITYDLVAACYNAIPFDANIASDTLESVVKIFNDYYVFRDSALTPDLKMPFTSAPVDIVKELTAIKSKNAYIFDQPLILYAPVIDGQQSIRVLYDRLGRKYSDCEATTIEGVPALLYLQKFADSLDISKDAGARLNDAIGSQVYSSSAKVFGFIPGEFSRRVALPEKPIVSYELQSPSKNGTPSKRELYSPVKKRGTYDVESATIPPKRTSDLPNAKLLGAGKATVFYQLQNPSSVGIVVVHTLDFDPHSPDDVEEKELECIAHYLSEFNRLKVSKIILDFQNNRGGLVNFASTIVQLFFPNNGPLDKILPQDMRVDKSIQTLSEHVFGKHKLYDASRFVDFAIQKKYENHELFLNPVTITRNDRSTLFTKHTGLSTEDLQNKSFTKETKDFPWTNNAANIRILSDGRCGSSCALSSYYLHNLYNVLTYSTGGIQGKELSIFSFAGGSVTDLNYLIETYNTGKVSTTLMSLRYKGVLGFPYLEVYAKGSDVPLEYDYSKYAAGTHLNFDPQNARSRDVMWAQVANDAWKSSKSKPRV